MINYKPIDSEIKSIRKIYDVEKPYFIDIYQREYKWTSEQTLELLTDIERSFNIQRPYFINSYLISNIDNKGSLLKSIVDGQQRLTTILLILIKLRNLLKNKESQKIFDISKLEKLISKTDDKGKTIGFVITNDNRKFILNSLYNDTELKEEALNETQKNLNTNYQVISKYYDDFFNNFDDEKIFHHIQYLLDNVHAVELTIQENTDVSTIFEVINSRGLPLKPHEILKAKLLGVLEHDQKEEANTIWESILHKYFQSQSSIDRFFRDYLRARYHLFNAQDNDYHKLFDTHQSLRQEFGDLTDTKIIFDKIVNEINFYAHLYLSLKSNENYEYIEYNKYLEQDIQYQLCLSAIEISDTQNIQDQKINIISKNYDKWHVILNLWNIYDSRDIIERYKNVIIELRNIENIQQIQTIIDNSNIEYLNKETDFQIENISKLFFNHKEFYNYNRKFTRYLLMRIELKLKEFTGQPSRIENFKQFCEFAGKKSNANNSIHIEHIYAWNNSNLALFENNEEEFRNERNKLGMVLLLLGSQNQSSNNESYQDKLDCYSKSDFIWNELLSNHIDDIIYKKLPKELQIQYSVIPNNDDTFPKAEILTRQKVIFNMIKFIWNF